MPRNAQDVIIGKQISIGKRLAKMKLINHNYISYCQLKSYLIQHTKHLVECPSWIKDGSNMIRARNF